MRRREFIAGLGDATVWLVVARAQLPMRKLIIAAALIPALLALAVIVAALIIYLGE